MTHNITGEEQFLNRTLASVGVPSLHILRAYNAEEYRFFELTGDLDEALHFNDFDETQMQPAPVPGERIRLGEEIALGDMIENRTRGRIQLYD